MVDSTNSLMRMPTQGMSGKQTVFETNVISYSPMLQSLGTLSRSLYLLLTTKQVPPPASIKFMIFYFKTTIPG
jgi:hypothetical protein